MKSHRYMVFIRGFMFLIFCVNFVEIRSSTTAAPDDDALCDCECDYFDKLQYWENITKYNELIKANATPAEKAEMEKKEAEKLQGEIKEVQGKLALNATNLSSNKMKKQSATDDRESATNVGIIGCVMMSSVGLALIICDLASIGRHVQPIRRNLGWLCK